MSTPQLIPTQFRKNGWHYKLVARTERGAIYSQSSLPDLPANGKACAYEVVRVRTREARTMTTKSGSFDFPAGEYLPHTEEWGRHGWTCATLPRAVERLNEISATPITKP